MMISFEKFCAQSMLICALLIFIGPLLIAGWLPPLSADMSAEQLKEIFVKDQLKIKIAMVLCGFSGMFYSLFGAAISTQIDRMGANHKSLARVQYSMAMATGIIISFIGFWGLALAFRADLNPDVLRFGVDFWWLTFAGWYVPALWQYITIAWAIFEDKDAKIYPKWVAYLNLWVSLSLMPGLYMAFFQTGPFAWHGILGFWLVAFGFFLWAFVMWRMTVKAIREWELDRVSS